MKKVLSMVLVLAMMLSLATVTSVTSTAAEGATSVGPTKQATGAALTTVADTDGEAAVEVGEVTYAVITTVDEFEAALADEAGGNYILAGDLDLDGAQLTARAIADGVVINGNGHAITNFSGVAGGAFSVAAGTVTFENISFGGDAVVTLADALFAVAAGATLNLNNVKLNATGMFLATADGCTLNFTNCTKDGDITTYANSYVGAYVGQLTGTASKVTFKNCINNGKVSAPNYYQIGGFIGGAGAALSNITFEQCKNAGAITTSQQQIGGFIGNVTAAATIKFEDCTNAGAVYGKQDVGGFIGTATNPDLTVKNSQNTAEVRSDLNGNWERAGGFVGQVNGGEVSFTGCTNSGQVTSKKFMGGIVGYAINEASLTIENCKNSGHIKTSANEFSGGIIGALLGNASATITNCENTGEIYAKKDTGGIVGGVGGTVSNVTYSASCTLTGCKNSGYVHSQYEQAGGIVGSTYHSSTATATHCINNGSVWGKNNTWTPILGYDMSSGAATRTMTGCANLFDDATEATAAPIYGGVQETAPANGVQKIRFLATVDSLNYHEVGFKVTVTANGVTGDTQTHAASFAYLTAKAGDTVETAKSLGGGDYDYIYTLTITDVPTTAGEIVFTIQTYVKNAANGEAILGAEQTVTYKNGEYQGPTAAN